MNKKHLFIGIILILLSSYYAFKNVSIGDISNALRAVRYVYLLPSIFLIALTFLFRAMRWHYLIRSIKDVGTSKLFSPLMVGFMGNILPARAGEFIRAYLLSKRENISFSASFATIFVERLMDMLMFLILLVCVLFFSADTFAQKTGGDHRLMGYMIKFGWISFIGSLGIFLFSALLQYKNEWAMNILNFLIKPLPGKWKEKITSLVHSFTDGLKILKDFKGFMASLLLSVMVWISIVFTYYPIHLAFGIESEVPMMTSVLIVSLTIGIFISLFPTPGFLGAFQAACVVALHEVFGVQKAVAASYGIIAWLAAMGFIILTGSIFIVKDNISFKELTTSKEQQNNI